MRLRRRILLLAAFGITALVGAFVPTPEISFTTVSVVERQAAAFERSDTPPEVHTETHTEAHNGDEGHADGEAQVESSSDGRMVASDDDAGEFQMIGVQFDEVPSEPVYVRAQNSDGTWQEWAELEVNPDEGPDDTENLSTPPVWVGEATGWEVSVGESDTDAEVLLVKEEQQRGVVESTEVAGANPATPGGMRSRASWGARPAKSPVEYASEVKLAVVHHSVSTNSYSAAQVPGVIKGIQTYHQNGNGWSDIGYNFVVDKYGAAWEARQGGTGSPVVGAHAKGFNTGSVGIVVLGDYSGVDPSPAARETVARIAGWKLLLHGHRPTDVASFRSGGSSSIPVGQVVNRPRVIGHRDVGSTACPGRIQNHLPSIRARAGDWFTWLRFTGSPVTTESLPKGQLQSVRVTSDGWVSFNGWALDPRNKGKMNVRIYIDGRHIVTVGASRKTTAVPSKYAAWGSDRGFAGGFGTHPGDHRVCAEGVAISGGATNLLGCADVTIPK